MTYEQIGETLGMTEIGQEIMTPVFECKRCGWRTTHKDSKCGCDYIAIKQHHRDEAEAGIL